VSLLPKNPGTANHLQPKQTHTNTEEREREREQPTNKQTLPISFSYLKSK